MELIKKDKLAERVKMHLAAQTPNGDGESEYDASGQVDAEKAGPVKIIYQHLAALREAIAKHIGE